MGCLYKDLGISTQGKRVAEIPASEIQTAWDNIHQKFIDEQKSYRRSMIKLHPDKIHNTAAENNLSPEELQKALAESEIKVRDFNTKFDSTRAEYTRKKNAYDQLINPETRSTYDAAHPSMKVQNTSAHASAGTGKGTGRTAHTTTPGHTYDRTPPGAHAHTSRGADGFKSSPFEDIFSGSTHHSNSRYRAYHGTSEQAFYQSLNDHLSRARSAGVTPDLRDYNFFNRDLRGVDLSNCRFRNVMHADLRGANLSNVDFSDGSLSFCKLDDTTRLDGAKFKNAIISVDQLPASLTNVDFTNASVLTDDINRSWLSGKRFEGCTFNRSSIGFNDIVDTHFKDCSFGKERSIFGFKKLRNVVVEGGTATENLFHYTSLENVTFRKVAFNNCDLSRASLRGVAFEGPMDGLILSHEQLAHVDVSKAQTHGVTVLDRYGKPVKNPFSHAATPTGKASDATKASDTAKPANAASEAAATTSHTANAERSFVERLTRTAEGKVHWGKVTAISVGAALAAGAAYALLKDEKQPANASWQSRVSRNGASPNLRQ